MLVAGGQTRCRSANDHGSRDHARFPWKAEVLGSAATWDGLDVWLEVQSQPLAGRMLLTKGRFSPQDMVVVLRKAM